MIIKSVELQRQKPEFEWWLNICQITLWASVFLFGKMRLKKVYCKNIDCLTQRLHLVNTNYCAVLGSVAQLCPILCYRVDGSLPGSSVHGDFPGKNTGVGGYSLHLGSSNRGIVRRSPALLAYSLPSEPQGTPPAPGIKPMPPVVKVQILNHWTSREVPGDYLLKELDNSLLSSEHLACQK